MSGLRILDGVVAYNTLVLSLPRKPLFSWLTKLFLWIYFIEYASLFGLALVPSNEVFEYHEGFTKLFGISQFVKMIAFLYLYHKANFEPISLTSEEKSKIWRKLIGSAVVNTIAMALGSAAYLQHSAICYPYGYSIFTCFEYIFVASNISFNWSIGLIQPSAITLTMYAP